MSAVEAILSGMRPTGKLHLGNYFGALENWVRLQDQYRCFYMIADWHALTSDYEDPSAIEDNIREMVIDWLAAGLDPARSVLFRQSWVPAHAELHLALSMITPLSWLERVPTYKEQMQQIQNRDLSTYGFLGYPLLQSADILLYNAARVPVGEDQLPHLEFTREIARRFNHFYGPVFTEPQALLSKAPRIPGLDNRKMSKSYNNAILISESASVVTEKIKQMFTDPQKIRANDPGHPEGCVVYANHQLFTPEAPDIESRCKAGSIGCVACKKRLSETMNERLEPLRTARASWASRPDDVKSIIQEGTARANAVAEETLAAVRKAMKMAPAPVPREVKS